MFNKEPAALNVVAIIQARMGSRRFPGKVLADLRGRPVLEWVVDAVKRVEGTHQIVVATTTNLEDQAIDDWCEKSGVNCFRGEPLDVLKRYADCARKYQASHVVRITADCPMLHPRTVSSVLRNGIQRGVDYFSLAEGFPDGFDCEGFTISALFRADREAKLASEREHVTPYIKAHPEIFTSALFEEWAGWEDFRLTVDEWDDLVFLSRAIELLESSGSSAAPESVLQLAADRPDLRTINSRFARNEGLEWSIRQENS